MRLIDADKLKEELNNEREALDALGDEGWVCSNAIDIVDNRPTVGDCGEWCGDGMDVICSICGFNPIYHMDADGRVDYWQFKPPFCPNCGASMTGGKAK